jgi:hemerythrin
MNLIIKPPIKIVWHASLELGIDIIDEQHKRLIGIINDLYMARFEQNIEHVNKTLDELNEYTRVHFATEEALMEKAGCACLEAHKLEHDQMKKQIKLFAKAFAKSDDVSQDLQSMLMNWLLSHTAQTDKGYSEDVKRFLATKPEPDKATASRWAVFIKKFKA